MKALMYLGPGRMELQDVPDPVPGPGEVRVRVRAAAICGSDLHGFREASPRRVPPLVMGHEAAGVVDAVGEGTDPALEGRRVVVMPVVSCGSCDRCVEGRPNLCPRRRLLGMNLPGAFAEAIVVPAAQALPVPEGLPDDAAALAEPYANGIHVAERAVRPGDDVLVIGAGPIGLFAAVAAMHAGASRTFVLDRLEDRLKLAAAQGAVAVAADVPEEVAEATGGVGVDVVIDAVGLPATWALAVDAVRFGGRVEAIGLGAAEGPLPYHPVVTKGIAITGSFACVRADLERAIERLAAGEPDVSAWMTTMPLAAGQAAFEALVEGRETKVVLTP